MITEQDLQEAIAECQGVKNPNANTCIKLAAYYTILNHITEENQEQTYLPVSNYSFESSRNVIDYSSDTEFSKMINGKNPQEIWPIIDELMETLKAVFPQLYNGVMRKLS